MSNGANIFQNTTSPEYHDYPKKDQDLARLIDYYRLLSSTFETERIKNYDLFQNIKISNEDQHKVEWEIKRRKDEIVELENALHETNMALNNERKKSIHFYKVIENCNSIAKEDKRRIKQLLELSGPIEQNIKIIKNKKNDNKEKIFNLNFNFEEALGFDNLNDGPDSVSITKAMKNKKIKNNNKKEIKSNSDNKYKNFELNLNQEENNNEENIDNEKNKNENMIKNNIISDKEKIEELTGQNLELKKEIALMKELYEEKFQKLEESRNIKEERFRQQYIAYKKKVDDLIKENQNIEKLNYVTAKDFLDLKYKNGLQDQKNYELLEKYKQENGYLEYQLKNVVKKSSQDKSRALKDYTNKTREISQHLSNQARMEDQKIKYIRNQYDELQKKFEPSLKILENKSKALIDKCKFLESKKMNEYIGYLNEIELMRKRIKTFKEYAEKINMKTGGNLKIQNIEENNDEEENYENENEEEAQQMNQGEEEGYEGENDNNEYNNEQNNEDNNNENYNDNDNVNEDNNNEEMP